MEQFSMSCLSSHIPRWLEIAGHWQLPNFGRFFLHLMAEITFLPRFRDGLTMESLGDG